MRLYIVFALLCTANALAQVNVLTNRNDNARTGQNLNETILAPATVNSSTFGRIFSYSVDGFVYAQPLYMAGVQIAGKGTHNVVFVATENDSVYAFDADDNTGANADPLWQVSFINPAQQITTVPHDDVNGGDLRPQIGITPTPVIDPASGTIYVLARTKEIDGGDTKYPQRLHALDIGSGAEKFGGPVIINASANGNCTPNDGNGNVIFDSKWHNARAGLLLANGAVYITWSSLGDTDPYQGWLMAYNARTLGQMAVFNVVPDDIDSVNHTCRGGIWQSGVGPAADADGNIFLSTGNGSFNASSGGRDFSDSILRFSASGMLLSDYFTPFNQDSLNASDFDVGSGAPMLLPDQPGPFPHLLVSADKNGTVYLLNRDNLGHYNPNGDQIVQELYMILTRIGEFGGPAYFNSTVYFGAQNDFIKAFRLTNGQLSATPVSQSATLFGLRGTTPSISASGNTNGILWALQTDAFNTGGPSVLHAYDAGDLGNELYNTNQESARDNPGLAVKFTVPTIAAGKVYVGTQANLSVFGPLNLPFVAHNYFDILERSPDPAGLAYYVNGLNSGTLSQAQVAAGIFVSPEFAGSGRLVAACYTGLLGRDPDYAGWNYWVTGMQQQGHTQQWMLDGFTASAEFASRYGNTDDTTYVTLLYQNVLKRAPAPSETAYWVGVLGTGVTRAEVAGLFANSPEFLTANLNRLNVDLMYLTLLRRVPDPDGFNFWLSALNGGMAVTDALGSFLAGPEYASRY